MTINGSTNNSNWTYKIEVTETGTNIQNRTSTIQVKTFIGRASSQGPIGGDYSNSVSITGATTQTQSGNIPWPTNINGGAWYELKTFTFTVPNTGNPTTVTISSTMSSGDFTPSYASASGTMQLTVLHLDPTIETAEMTETNAVLTALNVPNTTIVRHLSKKTIVLHATATDSATITYRLRHFNTNYAIPSETTYQNSNTFNTDYTQHDISIGSGKANIIQDIKDSLNGTATDWVYVSIGGTAQKPNGIPYAKPAIERTSTSIKRKSGGGVNLTDNKATLNLKATFYKENDIIGNNNSVAQIGYKIWASDDTEPANYTTLTPTISGGEITVSNLEISNINFIKAYNYKIKLTDAYGYGDEIIDGRVPIGVSIWTEYKDRVDFLKLTVGGYNPFEYSTSETKAGEWTNGKTVYRKVIDFGSLPDASATKSVAHNITNIDEIIKIEAIGKDETTYFPIPFAPVPLMYGNKGVSIRIDSINVNINADADFSSRTAIIILEYTKTTD